jgi:hypothetical protein
MEKWLVLMIGFWRRSRANEAEFWSKPKPQIQLRWSTWARWSF